MESSHSPPCLSPHGPFPCAFGRYRIDAHLGGGGMGTVYRAHDEVLQIDVALKVPRAELMADPVNHERFLHEARAAARLDHPNFARVSNVGVHDGIFYLALRYVPGRPLSKCPPGDPAAAAELVHTLAVALAEAHRRGVLHRDLKPSNIILMPEGVPVITDFGLSLRLDTADPRLSAPGTIVGTPCYMAPEQIDPDLAPLGPACDVYSLGVVLYELLAGRVPFRGANTGVVFARVLHDDPEPPSQYRPGLSPVLEAICLKAMARRVEDRFTGMDDFAAALAEYLAGNPSAPLPLPAPTLPTTLTTATFRPLVPRDCLRFAFAGHGEHVPAGAAVQDRLFLDVGNDLRPGVIDHHQESTAAGSTATLVLRRPDLVRGAVSPGRGPDAPFILVLHEEPDLDGVIAAWLASACLATGTFPAGAEALARYADKVDEGSVGMSLANPFALYAAHRQLANRLLRRTWGSPHQRWQECVRLGLELVSHVAAVMERDGVSLPAVDAFACQGLFTPEDRREVEADAERYVAKLRDPRTHARRARLRLPGQFGGRVEVESLRVRDVQNVSDPERCLFFKDWARTDAQRSPDGRGFAALSVFASEGSGQVRRCILSVAPDSGATLQGLGALLDEAEAARRRQVFGVDDRTTDPATGAPKPPRPGYGNADPWYDGRAHGWTIVDSPRAGTLLTAEEIEAIFLKFGGQ